jgi:hypothetical protein
MDDKNLFDLEKKLHLSSLKGLFMNMIVGLFIAVMVMVLSDILQKININDYKKISTCYGNIQHISLTDKLIVLVIFFIIFAASFNFYIKVVSFIEMSIINITFSYIAFIPNILAFSLIKYDTVICIFGIPNTYWLIPISIFFVLVKTIQTRYYLKNICKKIELDEDMRNSLKEGVKYFKKISISVTIVLTLAILLMALITFLPKDWIKELFGTIGGPFVMLAICAILMWFYYKNIMKGTFNAKEMRELIVKINHKIGYN